MRSLIEETVDIMSMAILGGAGCALFLWLLS